MHYKMHTSMLSVEANVIFEADASGKKAFLRNEGKEQIWGIKGQLKRVLSARNGILISF